MRRRVAQAAHASWRHGPAHDRGAAREDEPPGRRAETHAGDDPRRGGRVLVRRNERDERGGEREDRHRVRERQPDRRHPGGDDVSAASAGRPRPRPGRPRAATRSLRARSARSRRRPPAAASRRRAPRPARQPRTRPRRRTRHPRSRRRARSRSPGRTRIRGIVGCRAARSVRVRRDHEADRDAAQEEIHRATSLGIPAG